MINNKSKYFIIIFILKKNTLTINKHNLIFYPQTISPSEYNKLNNIKDNLDYYITTIHVNQRNQMRTMDRKSIGIKGIKSGHYQAKIPKKTKMG